MVEQPIRNRQVAGSSPALGSNLFQFIELTARYCAGTLYDSSRVRVLPLGQSL